jgi:hypothetical protein
MNWFELRDKIYQRFGEVNSIDKLMKDKLEPYVIMDELPLPIQIGEKKIYVGNLNLENESYYFTQFAKILSNLGLQNIMIDLMSDGGKLLTHLKSYKKLQKELTQLVIKTILKQQKWYYPKNDKMYKLNKCSYNYVKNYLTKEKLIQIIFLIYTYNYDSLGKSMSLVLNKMHAREITSTYMFSWLQNLPGATGNFLTNQLPNSDFYSSEHQALKSKQEAEDNG